MSLLKLAAMDPEEQALYDQYDQAEQDWFDLRRSIPDDIKSEQNSVRRKEALMGTLGGASLGAGIGSTLGIAKGLITRKPPAAMKGAVIGAVPGAALGNLMGQARGMQQGEQILQEKDPELHGQIEGAYQRIQDADDAMFNYMFPQKEAEVYLTGLQKMAAEYGTPEWDQQWQDAKHNVNLQEKHVKKVPKEMAEDAAGYGGMAGMALGAAPGIPAALRAIQTFRGKGQMQPGDMNKMVESSMGSLHGAIGGSLLGAAGGYLYGKNKVKPEEERLRRYQDQYMNLEEQIPVMEDLPAPQEKQAEVYLTGLKKLAAPVTEEEIDQLGNQLNETTDQINQGYQSAGLKGGFLGGGLGAAGGLALSKGLGSGRGPAMFTGGGVAGGLAGVGIGQSLFGRRNKDLIDSREALNDELFDKIVAYNEQQDAEGMG